jgi:hypothetical protein
VTAVILSFSFNSCIDLWGNGGGDPLIDTTESAYEPILMSREDMETSITLGDPQTMNDSGKIYLAGDYILVNDKYDGFHIYNNVNPTNPQLVKYLEVPGSTDVAIRNNVMYINQATDLIAISFDTNYQTITVTERVENVFPPLSIPPDGIYVAYDTSKIVLGWRLK